MSKRIDFPRYLIGNTYATIRHAFNSAKDIMVENGDMASINITSILTRIIQDTGRFAERWASDVLYTLDHIRLLCDNEYILEEEIDEIFPIAIRRDGVDSENFLMSRLKDTQRGPIDSYVYPQQIYRRILGVRVQVSYEYMGQRWHTPRITCTLRDMTDAFHQINPADIGEDRQLIQPPFVGGNPEPIDPYKTNQKLDTEGIV